MREVKGKSEREGTEDKGSVRGAWAGRKGKTKLQVTELEKKNTGLQEGENQGETLGDMHEEETGVKRWPRRKDKRDKEEGRSRRY